MKNPSIRCLFSGILVASLTTPSMAAQDQPLTIMITGSRTAQTVDETLASVTVINRAQIEKSSAATVSDILRATPGLSLTSSGGPGSNTSIFLRGTESDHTLILVDGIRMSSATAGTASFQNIPLNQIERIEIVRGSRSSLYGSDAIGGVIQVFTRQAQAGKNANLAVSMGTHSSQALEAGFSSRNENSWMSAQISSFETDGFDACRAEAATEFGGCFADEPDADGYENQALSLTGGVTLSNNVEASFNVLRADSELDFDGSFQNSSKATNQLVGAKLNIAASDKWAVTLSAARNKDHSDNFLNGAFASTFNTDRDQLGLQNDVQVGASSLVTVGIDYYNDKVSGTTQFVEDSRDNTGTYAQYQGMLGAHDIQFSVRSDDNQQFGSETTGGINVGHDFGAGFRLTSAYGTAFKAPTFNELYFPGFGNADLGIEKAKNIDVGLAWGQDATKIELHIFETKIDDLIAFDAASNAPLNVDQAKIQGAEVTLVSKLAGWDVHAGLTFLDAKNESEGDNIGNMLARRPETMVDVGMAKSWGDFSLGLDVHHQGSSFDDLSNTMRLDGFTTVGAKLGYQINSDWSAGLALNNLFDEEYETAQFYNQDGFNGLMTLRYTGKY